MYFSIYFCSLSLCIMALNLLFNIVFPWRQSPGLLHWLIWMVLPEEGWCGRPGRKSADSPCWHFLLPLLHPQLAVSRVLSLSSPLPISYWFHNKLYAIIVNTSQWRIFQYIVPFLRILRGIECLRGHGVWFVDTILLLGVAGRARAAKQSNNQSPKRWGQ